MNQRLRDKKSTIDDVAARSGFSRATVSRVLNKVGNVKPATSAKVERVMQELGFSPNVLARALPGGKTRTLAVVLPDVMRQYYAYLLAGADDVAEERGYHLLIKTGNRTKALVDIIEERRVDGFIIRNAGEPAVDRSVLDRLERNGLPFVFIGKPAEDRGGPSILIDNVGGARAMAHHYAEHGFRRILFIAGPRHSIDSNDRIYGFRMGLSERDVDPAGLTLAEGDFSRERGFAAAAEHLTGGNFEAVFASSDDTALGVLTWCNGRGVRVPGDLAITGYDDALFAECLWPPLTTVSQPMYQIGAAAVHFILTRLDGSKALNHQLIHPTLLKIRRSCGCSSA